MKENPTVGAVRFEITQRPKYPAVACAPQSPEQVGNLGTEDLILGIVHKEIPW